MEHEEEKLKQICSRCKQNLMGTLCSLQMLPYWAALRDSKCVKNNTLNVLKLSSLKLVSSVVFYIILQQIKKVILVVPWEFKCSFYTN